MTIWQAAEALNAKLTTARTFLNDVDTSFTTKKTNLSTNLDTSANLFQTAVDDTTVGEALKKHNSDIDTKISAVKTAVQALITRLQNQLTTATTNRDTAQNSLDAKQSQLSSTQSQINDLSDQLTTAE